MTLQHTFMLHYVLYIEVCGNECSNSDVSRELRQERQMEDIDKTSSASKSYSTFLIS